MLRWGEVADDDTGPRRSVLYVVALTIMAGGFLFAVMSLVLWLQGRGTLLDVWGAAGLVVLGGVVFGLTRRGWLGPAGLLMIVLLTLVPTYFLLVEGPRFAGILFFAAGVIFADLVVGRRVGLLCAAVNSLIYLGLGLGHRLGWLQVLSVSPFLSDLCAVALILLGLAVGTRLFTQGMRRAIYRAEEHEAALRAADEEKARLLLELQAREETRRRLSETVRELVSPVIPLARGIIATPIIGTVDSVRAQQIRTSLLRAVAENRARVVLIDITGVAVVDTAVAQALLQTAQGIELLGARPVLVGIRSEVAQTLVEMGVDMAGIATRATLQEGLEYGRALMSTFAVMGTAAASPIRG